jgi:uncharacterized protein
LYRSLSALRLAVAVAALVYLAPLAYSQSGLVISQVYGGGGNSGATYKYDYLELYNGSASAIDLSTYSLQYASATGTSWSVVSLTGAIQPGSYFHIRGCTGNNTSTAPDLPVTPDFSYPNYSDSTTCTGNLSATAGKISLVSNQTALSGTASSPASPLAGTSCPSVNVSALVDMVGYGTTATCHEGATAAPGISATTADTRATPPVDTNVNGSDFTTTTNIAGASGGTALSLAIHAIQGSKPPTSSTVSPYAGQKVTTTGVVTAVLSNGFFIQARDTDADTDPSTPEGIEIFTSSAPPAAAAIGNYVSVTGTVSTFPAASASHTPATEITSPTVTLISTGAALPTAVNLTSSSLTPSGGLYQLTRYEGMRVSIASLTAVSGTNGSITSANEPTETATSTGYFYAVITGTARPFREPGIDLRDTPVPSAPTGIAVFDDNPERILVDSSLAGGTSLEIATGAVLPNVTGVLDFTFSSDSFYDPSRLILDASYNRANVTSGMSVQAVPLPGAKEFTVASYNVERFYNPAQSTSDDLYYVPAGVTGFNGNSSSGTTSTGQTFTSAAVDVTSAAYTRRLQKVSLSVRNVLNLPDVVTLEEVENQSVANDIAAQINTDAGVANLYTAYSTDNSTYYTQDGTGISVGFLVKNTVNKLSVSQFGQKQTFTPTTSTNPITLNDRPWLVLQAGVKRGTGIADYPVTIIVNHMKALTGVNSTTSTSTRQKKELQAEAIATYIQGLQASGKHVISGGDFNAFEFSDGYTDTLATYTNTNVLPATQVVQPGVAGLVTPPLVDLTLTLPGNQRWSYVEDGNAQVLDHIVVTSDLATAGAHLAYAHVNSDFPATAYNDATTPARSSDHDIAVGYFSLPAPVLSGELSPTTITTYSATSIGTSSVGQQFVFTNSGEGPVTITAVTTTGDYSASTNCNGTSVAVNATCSVNVIFKPTAAGTRNGTVTFATNISGATFTGSLTGTGSDFSIGDSNGSSSTTVTVPAGSYVAFPLTFKSVNGFSGTISLTCTPPSSAPLGVICYTPPSLTLSGPSTSLVVTIATTPHYVANLSSGKGDMALGFVGFFGLLGPGMLLARRRCLLDGRLLTIAGLLLTVLAVCTSGCTSSRSINSNATPPGTYVYTVTAVSGTLSHTETINLVVQ